MGKKDYLGNVGQSAVEYIFLLAVVMTLVAVVTKSEIFNRYLGPNGVIFKVALQNYEFSYQHALPKDGSVKSYNPSSPNLRHPSFVKDGLTRFFTPDGKYP